MMSASSSPPRLQASPFFDHLVFSKVAARLGGNVKAIVNGGAPLSTHVEEFLRASMCCPVVQVSGRGRCPKQPIQGSLIPFSYSRY